MAVQVVCNGCDTRLIGKDEHRGRALNCPKCTRPVYVPVSSTSGAASRTPSRTPPVSPARPTSAGGQQTLPASVMWCPVSVNGFETSSSWI